MCCWSHAGGMSGRCSAGPLWLTGLAAVVSVRMGKMTQDEVVVQLKKLLSERLRMSSERVQALGLDSPLLKDGLGLDSLDCVELLIGIEDEFGLAFDESEEDWMHHFSSLRALSGLVLSAKGELT